MPVKPDGMELVEGGSSSTEWGYGGAGGGLSGIYSNCGYNPACALVVAGGGGGAYYGGGGSCSECVGGGSSFAESSASNVSISANGASVTISWTPVVDQPLAGQVSAGRHVLSCAVPGSFGYPATTCTLVNLTPVTFDGRAQTATGTARIYVSDTRGNPAVGPSLSTYMVPTPSNPNASYAGRADFCNSAVGSNAPSPDGQIPASDLAVTCTSCAAPTGNSNTKPTLSDGSYGSPFTLCAASAGQSRRTFTMSTTFSLSVPFSVYDGTVEYLVS
jgi:hypothetical protein